MGTRPAGLHVLAFVTPPASPRVHVLDAAVGAVAPCGRQGRSSPAACTAPDWGTFASRAAAPFGRSVEVEKEVDHMTLPKMLQSPDRDVLLVSTLISTVVVLAFTEWGVMAYLITGLVFAVLFLVSAIANRRANHR